MYLNDPPDRSTSHQASFSIAPNLLTQAKKAEIFVIFAESLSHHYFTHQKFTVAQLLTSLHNLGPFVLPLTSFPTFLITGLILAKFLERQTNFWLFIA